MINFSAKISRFIFFIVDNLSNINHTDDLRNMFGARSSVVEHLTFNQRVTGSSPVGHTTHRGSMFSIMPSFVQVYLPIVIFFCIALVIAIVAVGIPLFFAEDRPDKSKLAPYECGFKEFDSSRRKFDVRFYLVAHLLIDFDIQLIFLFPWSV